MYSAVEVQEVLQRRRELWGWGAKWLAIRSWQQPLRAIIKADPLTTTWKAAQELNVDHSVVIWHLKKIGNVKKLDKWVPHELTANQKKKQTSFWSVIFSYSTQQHTVSQSDCDMQQKMDFIWQWTMTSCWLYWEEAPKHFPKPNLHHTHTHTQRPWSLFGGLLLV